MFIQVDNSKSYSHISKRYEGFLPIKELSKLHGIGRKWLKNRLNKNVKGAKSEIDYFRYDGSFYWRAEQFKKWYNFNYPDDEGRGTK